MKFMVLIFLLGILGVLSKPDRHLQKRQAATDKPKWPNATLYYSFSSNLPLEFLAMFRDAFSYISDRTCIRFRHDEHSRKNYSVRIRHDRKRKECFSTYGMFERKQTLRFDYNCASFGNAVHELMHALGIYHQMARSDRDQYLVVDATNHNFNLESTFNLVPFDYGSVMLYPRSEYMYPRDPEHNYTMGNPRVAFYDMLLLNKFYECTCDGHHPQLTCQNGGYQNPSNCNECLCTDGFQGVLCEETKQNEDHYEATVDWQDASFKVQNMYGPSENTRLKEHYLFVTAPQGKTIEVQLTKLSGFFCHDACDFNGVEIKYKEDRRIVSPLVCCDNDNLWNRTRSTTNNPLVIVMYGEDRGPELAWRYRYVDSGLTDNIIN